MSKEELEIISEGRSLGWTDNQCLLAVQQNRHNIKVAAEKARVAKENERLKQEAKAKYDQDILDANMEISTIDNNAILEFNKKDISQQKELLNNHNEYMKSRDESFEDLSLSEYKDVLKESRIDMTSDIEDYFSKISESSATWNKNKDVKTSRRYAGYKNNRSTL